jgi:hypothetical protein
VDTQVDAHWQWLLFVFSFAGMQKSDICRYGVRKLRVT